MLKESINISKKKRDKMIKFLENIKESNPEEEVLIAINTIENHINNKKYGLVWEEHEEDVDLKIKDKLPIFNEYKSKKIVNNKENKNYNFLLQGDNLASLYLLEKTHRGKIDLIYIDPPYNTGNEDFIYNDKIIDTEDSYRHSKWLSFMSRRLKQAYKLLSDDGSMFISIDDNEQPYLKILCDEIFSNGLVETYIWDTREAGSMPKTPKNTVRKEHEYLIACYKNSESKLNRYPVYKYKDKESGFSNPDNDPKGPWMSGNMSRESTSTTQGSNYYTIITPAGVEFSRNWSISEEEYNTYLKEGRIHFANNGKGVPRLKIYKNDLFYNIQSSFFDDVKSSIYGSKELKEVFNKKDVFPHPKPTTLIKRIMQIAGKKDSIILDFFAGSGTTGQAVLDLNAEDGGNRKFILCTNNEVDELDQAIFLEKKGVIKIIPKTKGGKLSKNTDEYNQFLSFKYTDEFEMIQEEKDYEKLGICERITYPRLKTVLTGIRLDNSKYSSGFKENLKYYKCDWIDRKPDDYFLHPTLCKHVKEMIELENHIDLDNEKYILLLNKNDIEKYIIKNDKKDRIKRIWLNENIIINNEELDEIKKYNFSYIPRNYFGSELKEVGE